MRVHLAGTEWPVETVTDEDQWVRVRGRVVSGTGNRADGFVPTLRVTSIEPVATPSPVYE